MSKLYELYDLEHDIIEDIREMTATEAERRNSALRAENEYYRWVPRCEDDVLPEESDVLPSGRVDYGMMCLRPEPARGHWYDGDEPDARFWRENEYVAGRVQLTAEDMLPY